MEFCEENKITFTRSRAYRKNDQCFVEQKNGDIVRHVTGYSRFAGETARTALESLYNTLRIYTNLFQPSMKLVEKTRDGAKVAKKYDRAKTPYRRLQEAGFRWTEDTLAGLYNALDPVTLLDELKSKQQYLLEVADRPPLFNTPEVTVGSFTSRGSVFDSVQPLMHAWLLAEPAITTINLLKKLRAAVPGCFDTTNRTTLYRYIRHWKERESEAVSQ